MVIKMIFDSHAHYDDEAFDTDRNQLLSDMKKNGIEFIVNVGADMDSCKTTLALTEEYSFLYGALGIHPSETGNLSQDNINWLKESCKNNSVKEGGKISAVGEIGLDYYWDDPDRVIQKKWFEVQIEMAKEVKLPIIVHSREAAKDTADMMKATNAEQAGGVVHCFSYSKEMAKDFLAMGFAIGIGGVATFKNAHKLIEVIDYLPLDSILIETDCPYLAPEPYRGKRNSSLYLPFVVKRIAEIKGIDTEEVIQVTGSNAKKLFGI